MPTTRPGFIWSGTEWIAIGQEAVVNPFYYQATAPTSPATGAIWVESDVDVPSIDSSQFLRWRKTMAGGETSLSGNDDSSLPLAYTPGYEQLYINGVLQVRGGDYTATTGTTVTGLTALVANDVVEIFSAVARTVADVYTQTQSDARFVNSVNNGMFLVKKQTFGTAVTSINVTSAFNSTYDSYKIILIGGSTTGTGDILLKLGSTTSGYKHGMTYFNYTSAAVNGEVSSNGAAWGRFGGTYASGFAGGNCELDAPFLAQQTYVRGNWINADYTGSWSGVLANTTSYTDFTLTLNVGTITGGTVYVYGYNKGA